jgi:hypothetical protein
LSKKATETLEKAGKKFAADEKDIQLQKESAQKARDAAEALKQKYEKEHKAKMDEVIILKSSVESEKASLKEKDELIEEKRLKAVALENKVQSLIKRYNLEKEAKG